MRVRELWRYPVKSMAGERLERAEVQRSGFVGDRLWAVRDDERGVITSGKKIPKLMLCAARFIEEPPLDAGPGKVPHVILTLPGGTEIRSDDPRASLALSSHVGRKVSLSALRPARERSHFRADKHTHAKMREIFGLGPDEALPDLSMLPLSLLAELGLYATPRGTYFDAYSLHVLTTASLEALREKNPDSDFDPRRFRPNVVVETTDERGFAETGWCGSRLRAGSVVATIEIPTVRCSMPTRAQPGLRSDPSVMKTVAAEADRCVGVYASVRQPGRLEVGNAVELDVRRRSKLAEFAHARATDMKRLILRAAAATLPKR